MNQTYPLLEKDVVCADEPCLLNGTHVPALDFDVNHFVGVSEYWHTTHGIFEMGHKDKAYDLNTYQTRVSKFCSTDWKKIQQGLGNHEWGKEVDEKTAIEVCFKASWIINILHEGIGIPRVGLENNSIGGYNGTKAVLDKAKEKGFTDSFRAVNKIGDTELSWTLGKMVLYASSQIPALDAKFPVGFGSNILDGLPPDFQYADFLHARPKNTSNMHETPLDPNIEDWRDTLLTSQSPRRIPGLLLFILILCLAVYLLCGRERRTRLFRKIFRSSHPHSRRRKLLLPIKVPFFHSSNSSSGGAYERVLEDGAAADQFELSHADADPDSDLDVENDNSDDSAGSWTVKSSGWATPRIVGGSAGAGGLPESNYFDPGGPGIGLGISGNPMGRSGLVGRTESRERLFTLGMGDVGRKSRRGSPTRGKTPALGILAED